MNNEERKKELYKLLSERNDPITGTELAALFHVTRQVIVQDIALLRAEKKQILSTKQGYLLQSNASGRVRRTVTVCHEAEEIENELKLIVDLGGTVVSTEVDHPFYGKLGEKLNVKSRRDIKEFNKRLYDTGCEPLLSLTKGIHKHVIEADSEAVLEEIYNELKNAGYLQ